MKLATVFMGREPEHQAYLLLFTFIKTNIKDILPGRKLKYKTFRVLLAVQKMNFQVLTKLPSRQSVSRKKYGHFAVNNVSYRKR